MTDISNDYAHYLQNELDIILDMVNDFVSDNDDFDPVKDKIQGLRDSIPCDCGKTNTKDSYKESV